MNLEYLKLYGVSIRVDDPRGRAYGHIDYLQWKDMSLQQVTKWRWYFDYRAALLKVKYPRSKVEFTVSQYEPNQKTIADFLKDKIKGKKRMITKLKNEIQRYENFLQETNIFGVAGDDGRLVKAKEKLCKYQNELEEVEAQMKNVYQSSTP